MALRHMAEFMRQHGGQLICTADHGNQAGVHAHVAARQRKGIDAAVSHQKQVPGKAVF